MSLRTLSLAALALASPALGQTPPERTIQVAGTGTVRTPPDLAVLEFWLRGEGATPDAATSALAAQQKAVIGGLTNLLGRASEVTTGPVTMIEVRGPGCEDGRGYNNRPRLSEGTCAVIGHLATVQGSVRTSAVDKAGTATGLASRLGASDARLQSFSLADPADANRRAAAAALRDAQLRAATLAEGAGFRLGPIVTINDSYRGEVTVMGAMARATPPPPPPPEMAAPVSLETRPRPIETRAQVSVVYTILP